ncbi:hypothetical protein JXB41_04010 [Candidatus Woesearchaeota archaeon]|nr:hypothetical protein [Candidatus Woesearchaeota archaeon]
MDYQRLSSKIKKEVDSSFKENLGRKTLSESNKNTDSLSYKTFKKEQKEEFSLNSFYEKYCSFSEKIFGFISFGEKTEERIKEEIEISGINVTSRGVVASLFMTQIIFFIIAIPSLFLGELNFTFFVVCTGAFLGAVSYTYTGYSAEITKIKAEQESILAILYMTIYMRVNPILENAMYFASEHLNGPLGKDLKQCLWLVDNEKVGSLEDSIQYFIPLWIKRNKDFVKSILILHSALEQPSKEDQARILDKSLDMILDSTYEKMKHYAHDLQTPVTILHTFGMMLPLIGLIAFPMLSVFMFQSIKISHLFFGYIIIMPMLLLFFTRRIIAKRPGAFSYPDITHNPYVPPDGTYRFKIKDKSYLLPALTVALLIGFLVIVPGVYHVVFYTAPAMIENQKKLMTGSKQIPKNLENEYELTSILMTLTIPLGIGLAIALYFYLKSIQKLKIRNEVIEIEDDLGGALFQFSNQFTERIPIEEAVQNFVNEYNLLNLKQRSIFQFFSSVLDRMQQEGVTFYQSIFQPKLGIIIRYPSILLKEITWIISEGAKKGSSILYNILIKISTYLDNTKKIKELIYDLLTETVASVNTQAKILSPFIAAIVGSLTAVIIRALWIMSQRLEEIMKSLQMGMAGVQDSTSFFGDFVDFTRIVPPTVFQILVGIYMVETVVLLSLLANGVENGFDKVSRDVTIARNMFIAITVYTIVTIIGSYALNSLIQTGTAL